MTSDFGAESDVVLTIEPRVSPNVDGFLAPVTLGRRDFDFTGSASEGLATIRRRVDRNEWDYGVAVVDNLKLPMLGLGTFGGVDYPASIFRLMGRDGARVRVFYKGLLIYTGFLTETDSKDDLNRDATTIQTLGPEQAMRLETLAAAPIADNVSLEQAIRACFAPDIVARTLGALSLTLPPRLEVGVDIAASLEGLSAWDTLNTLLLTGDLAAVFEPDTSVWIGPRGRRPDRAVMTLTRGEVLSITQSAGRNRLFTALDTPTSETNPRLIIAEVTAASAQYGRRPLSVDLGFVAPELKEGVLFFLLERLSAPAKEYQVLVPFDVMDATRQAVLPMDPVDIKIDAAVPAFSAQYGTARYGSSEFAEPTTREVVSATYVVEAKADFRTRTLAMVLKEDVGLNG